MALFSSLPHTVKSVQPVPFGSLFALITKHVWFLRLNSIRYYFAAGHTYRQPFAGGTMPTAREEGLDPSHVL